MSVPPLSEEGVPHRLAARAAVAGVLSVGLLAILWEVWLAPARPGGSWLALKGVPALLLAPALFRGRRRAGQAATLLLPWYFAEGLVRAITEPGRHRLVAATAAALALATFIALLAWLRRARPAA